VNSPPCASGRRRQQGSAVALEKWGIAPKIVGMWRGRGNPREEREEWEWEPRGRDTQCLNSPLAGGPRASRCSTCGARTRVAASLRVGGAAHVHTACSHGCAVKSDSTVLLTSHCVCYMLRLMRTNKTQRITSYKAIYYNCKEVRVECLPSPATRLA
jgi:hypothetical protein